MNSPNIQHLIDYIQKNASFSPVQLEEIVLKTGYTKEEFYEALKIARNTTTTANQAVSIPKQKTKSHKALVWASLGCIVLLLVCGLVASFYLSKKRRSDVRPLAQTTSRPPATAGSFDTMQSSTSNLLKGQVSKSASKNNPMTLFRTALASVDVKVLSNGTIETKKLTERSAQSNGTEESAVSLTSSSSLDLNNGVFYVQKGAVVRLDNTDRQQTENTFTKDSKFYIVNTGKKTYTVVHSSDSVGQFYSGLFPATFPLLSLADDTQQGTVVWKNTSSNEWVANWKWKSPLDSVDNPVQVKIILDPPTHLVTTLSMKFEDSQPWQDVTFAYEKIDTLDTLLIIPADYKEEPLEL